MNSASTCLSILVGQGAVTFAQKSGLTVVDPLTLISDRARQEWQEWKTRFLSSELILPVKTVQSQPGEYVKPSVLGDTVGAVAIDCHANVAAGVSR